MTDYREIMRLRSLGLNHNQIAESLGASRTTVIHTLQRAAAQSLDWQAAESLKDKEIAVLLFPGGEGVPSYKEPDYDYVHRELMKPNVTQQLLWMEYCDRCRDEGTIPYQLTAFKRHYREYAAQTKATMHINRKPGETMEVHSTPRNLRISRGPRGRARQRKSWTATREKPFEFIKRKVDVRLTRNVVEVFFEGKPLS